MSDVYDSYDEEKLSLILERRYNYEPDEIKVLFPTEDKKREALRSLDTLAKGESVDEDALGWDSSDKTLLTTSQEQQITDREEQRQAREEAKKRVADAKQKASEDETMEAVKEDNTGLTREEIRNALKQLGETVLDEETSED